MTHALCAAKCVHWNVNETLHILIVCASGFLAKFSLSHLATQPNDIQLTLARNVRSCLTSQTINKSPNLVKALMQMNDKLLVGIYNLTKNASSRDRMFFVVHLR